LIMDNPPIAEEHARFSPREVDVVRAAARGFPGKHIAYSLGISSAAVSDNLRSAALKLGLPTRHDLVRVTASMLGQRPSTLAAEQLTPAERDVLELLRRGLTNQQIAALRGRSINTVKNQVAALMRKTGGESRRALGLTDS
jgi:DNA-binding NarL/FixJ family response regulator